MNPRKVSEKKMRESCDAPGPGDGLDPRLEPRDLSGKVKNRKALQLCGQVAHTLAAVLAGECGDAVLRDLAVESVVPAPNASRLLVTVYPLTLGGEVNEADVLARLDRAAGLLRGQVAAAIHRRKTPELLYRVIRNPGLTR